MTYKEICIGENNIKLQFSFWNRLFWSKSKMQNFIFYDFKNFCKLNKF